MPYGKMPPQAYTKETLQEAFEWWSEQPEELRSKIQDKDDLVGYYLRINRGIEPPKKEGGFTKAGKESFSSELKGLVKNLDAFEGYDAQGNQTSMPQKPERPHPQTFQVPGVSKQTVQAMPPQTHVFEPASQLQFPEMSKTLVPTQESVSSSALTITSDSQNQFFRLDDKSKKSVSKAREILNLSSDEEALRALISLGGAKIKGLI